MKMNRNNWLILSAITCMLLLVSCRTQKNAVSETGKNTGSAVVPVSGKASAGQQSQSVESYAFLEKVAANRVYAKNIVSDMSFTLKSGNNDITVPGSVHMRRDEVIRLQLFIPLLGTEVGRIEFTPNEVLIIDRMHKEYLRGDYNALDFLRNNGISFYTLQALFWNELSAPGVKTVSQNDFNMFKLGSAVTATSTPVVLEKGNLKYNWTASNSTGQILMTNVEYVSTGSGASSLMWLYSDFMNIGTKLYPARQEFQFSTTATKTAKNVKVTIDMSDPKDKDGWETRTQVSSKYKRVDANVLLSKLLKL